MDKAKEVTAIKIIATTLGSQDLSFVSRLPQWSSYVQIPAFYRSPVTVSRLTHWSGYVQIVLIARYFTTPSGCRILAISLSDSLLIPQLSTGSSPQKVLLPPSIQLCSRILSEHHFLNLLVKAVALIST